MGDGGQMVDGYNMWDNRQPCKIAVVPDFTGDHVSIADDVVLI